MSAPDIDKTLADIFRPLAGTSHHLTFILGAGASAPSGLPTWDQFAIRVATLSGLVEKEDTAASLLERQDHAILLEAAKYKSGDRWAEYLFEALYGTVSENLQPSPLHLAVVGHYLSDPKRCTIATLNFDPLLEEALSDNSSEDVYIGIDGIDEPDESHTVHHLHGALYIGEDEYHYLEPIITFKDFAELVDAKAPWQKEFLEKALRKGPILLAGTSYRDPDIRQWLHEIMMRAESESFFSPIVTIVREGLRLDKEVFDEIDGALAAEWEAIGIKALRLQDLSDVAALIRELESMDKPDYVPPQKRAQQVWKRHKEKFKELQPQYSAALSTSATEISSHLGMEALKCTLWIANGYGSLARWATESTHYLSVNQLKLVPTGHDSPWIAGEAISTEEPKIKNVIRDNRLEPRWKSVIAVPIFVGDGNNPDFASAVLTCSMKLPAEEVLRKKQELELVIGEQSSQWSELLNSVAFQD
ncbi:hypothetical protein HD598_001701 [Neomicrococcus aestuarii]|uniref:SIR2-like domain-containing protein n=1 Tax=Neomicrococcus aestuarii TaxID=556325 RepID=A0A7W8TUD5_9MICC|nr:SIR2 family protein [Neomicrococcus aestuarii]MBB5513014.1 hypothetical protein [Neomicrococcus aestuarii]